MFEAERELQISNDEAQLEQFLQCDEAELMIERLDDFKRVKFEKLFLKTKQKQTQKFLHSTTKQRITMYKKKHRLNGASILS